MKLPAIERGSPRTTRVWPLGRDRHISGVEIRRNVGQDILRLLDLLRLLRLLSLLRLLRRRLGLLLGLGQLILHCLQLSVTIDLLLQLSVVGEGGRGNQEAVPSTVPASSNPSLRLTSISSAKSPFAILRRRSENALKHPFP